LSAALSIEEDAIVKAAAVKIFFINFVIEVTYILIFCGLVEISVKGILAKKSNFLPKKALVCRWVALTK
tara:strand:+ start:807 stop:1013 length:207 start_codon:yes stop_codon:yes gene_type:complete